MRMFFEFDYTINNYIVDIYLDDYSTLLLLNSEKNRDSIYWTKNVHT